jgi:predicted enzyme related to lactoylglutathione lyase
MAAPPADFIWYELLTEDQDAAIRFYEAVVGWTAADFDMPGMEDYRYTILSAGDRGVGGIAALDDAARAGGLRPGWIGYIGVPDTDAAARAAVEAGAMLRMGPEDIPGVGRFALLADPGRALFYVMTPLPRETEPPAAEPGALGHVGWHELYADDGQAAAFDFYAGQFGWETLELMDMGAMGQYRIFGSGERQIGGMMDKPPRSPGAAWGFYVNTDGIDAAVERIRAHGGEVLMGPHQVPGDSWVVQARDPQGAAFALVSTAR